MHTPSQRFFVALLPPQEVQEYVDRVQQEVVERYNSHAAQKSPPHITLIAPFEWSVAALPTLVHQLGEFALTQAPIPVTLDGFGAFPPRVLFIDVHHTPQLLDLQRRLVGYFKQTFGIVGSDHGRQFIPHVTVAFRDLSAENFNLAWREYSDRPLYFTFTANYLTLLRYNDRRWAIAQEFPMQKA